MSNTASIDKPVAVPNEPVLQLKGFWVHVAGLIVQIPLLAIYFRTLWDEPHYQFFPIALALTAFLVVTRVSWQQASSYSPGKMTLFLLLVALPFLLASTVLFDVDLVALGSFFYAGSLLVSLRDNETGRTLLPVWFILAVIVRPPLNMDNQLITELQKYTSTFSSVLLDYLRVDHIPSGNVLELIGHPVLGVAEQCSGVQSLYTLLFCSIAFAVYFRRPWFRSLLLVISAVFWALFMNTMRVTVIAYALSKYNINLTEGIEHAILGYVMLGIAVLMIISTDFFLTFVFGPVTDEIEGGNAIQQGLQRFWNRVVAGQSRENNQASVRSSSSLPVMALSVAVIVIGIIPSIRVGPGRVIREVVKPFSVVVFNEDVCADSEGTFKLEKFLQESRDRNSEWGRYSDSWQLASTNGQGLRGMLSCDYPFKGWHELTTCYRGNGWQIEGESKQLALDDLGQPDQSVTAEEIDDWPIIETEFSKPVGQRRYLLFSLVDEDGMPVHPPGQARFGLGFVNRFIDAVKRRVDRPYGPDKQTYQIQFTIQHYRPLTNQERILIRRAYVEYRNRIKEHVASKSEE